MQLGWVAAAPKRPRNPANPRDPAYHWSTEIDYAIQQAARYHMRILLQVSQTPRWANSGHAANYPPSASERPGRLRHRGRASLPVGPPVDDLAAAVGVQLIVESPVRTIETNVPPPRSCSLRRVRSAVQCSSPLPARSMGSPVSSPSERMGRSSWVPPTVGGGAYACSKALDEFLALAYHRERMLPTVVGRMFNTVGPRQTGRYGMVVPTFVRQALANEPITVFGSGEQQRCFCHVHDVVRALAELPLRGELYGEVLNIGSTEEVSMLELAERVKRTTGSESEIVLVPYSEAYEEGFEDMPRRVPDTSKIERALGWRATASLDEILSDVIAHELAANMLEAQGAPSHSP